MNTIGYKELFLFIEKKLTFEQSIEEIKKNSRRFAKRQITWLKRKEDIIWVNNDVTPEEIKRNYFDFE